MSYLGPPPAQHVILLDKISRALIAEDIPRFKNRCLAEGVRPGEVERHSVLELLQLLDRRRVIAPGKYDKLVQVLTDIGRGDLVQEFFPLKRGQENQSTASPISCQKETDNHPPHHHCRHHSATPTMNSVVTEKALSWLASKMGADWEQIGIQCLGMSKNDIFQCKADNPYTVQNQIFSLLNKWRCRSGYNVTYAQLFEMLLQFQEFDKNILEEMQTKIPTF
ncbi:uncharacterized protein LOC119743520 [Patiria miniata]|uniref:Uncharacterized protein n=1 Tax=Patiria miniata TaxID=46514 RepID=A0A914BIY5_PATMI|nr:uncharacterized protein LOC119743520 [Patiria miniata]